MVEPPEAQTQAIAFSSESRVITLLGLMSSTRTLMTSSPIRSATVALLVVFGGDHRRAAGADPERLEGAGHRVGGELAAAGAGAGAGDALELVQFLVAHVAGVVGADRLEDVEDRDVAAVPVPGGDRAAVEQRPRGRRAGPAPSRSPGSSCRRRRGRRSRRTGSRGPSARSSRRSPRG